MNYWEAQELACVVLNLDYDKLVDEGEADKIEEALYEKFEIGFDQFVSIASALLKLTPVVQSAIMGNNYHAFVNEKEGIMIVKEKVEENDS